MNSNELMIEADKLLQRWKLYGTRNRSEIEKIFNGINRYDMMLNIEVFQEQAVIFILERGVKILEYRTNNMEILIYFVIQDIVQKIVSSFICDSYADEKGYLHFTQNIREHKKELENEAFSLMGEPYYEWHKQGVTVWNVADYL